MFNILAADGIANEGDEIKNFALDNGLRTLADDALEKVRAGLTTLDEIRRVLGTD